jgi:hypothetical protein
MLANVPRPICPGLSETRGNSDHLRLPAAFQLLKKRHHGMRIEPGVDRIAVAARGVRGDATILGIDIAEGENGCQQQDQHNCSAQRSRTFSVVDNKSTLVNRKMMIEEYSARCGSQLRSAV